MVQRNTLLSVTHQNRNRKWMEIAARDLGVTQWETRGEKEQKSWELIFFKKKRVMVGVEEQYREMCIGSNPDLLSLLWDRGTRRYLLVLPGPVFRFIQANGGACVHQCLSV